MATYLSFSTMWAQQERWERDMAAFRRTVASWGFTGIEVSHSTDEAGLRLLMSAGEIPLTSLHAPTPMRRLADGRHNGDTNLASVDEEERRMAVAETLRTVEFAASAGLDRIVVHLGGVGDMKDLVREPSGYVAPPEAELRRLFLEETATGEEVEALRDGLARWRSAGAEAALASARKSLRELAAVSEAKGVALGLESRLHYHEIPHPDEALALVSEYANEVCGYWHDVGHCEVQARLGMIDRASWFPKLSARTIGSHLHDVDGLLDHRAPGNGDVDWGYIASGLPAEALRVFEINQHEPDEAVAAAIGFLRERDVIE
ncbi:MAG: TIM barrel protein [Dehalococcoidia bacterium]|nr:TIM barrel protein [Dehalococcoidia bacterium]